MDVHEARLLDRLKDYQRLQKELEECIEDIDELLLIYDFDIDAVSQKYPILKSIMISGKKSPSKRIRTFFNR